MDRHDRMPDRIHADVDAMQPPGVEAEANPAAAKPQANQLSIRDHTMLSRRKLRHPPVTWAI